MSGRSSLFKKTLLTSITAVAFFSIVFGFISFWVARQFQNENPQNPSAVNYAKILSQISYDKRFEALETISESTSGGRARWWLLDKDGTPEYPKDTPLPEIVKGSPALPSEAYEFKNIGKSQEGPSAVIVKLSGAPAQYLMITYRPPGFRRRELFYVNFVSLVLAAVLGTSFAVVMLFLSLRKRAQLADSVISELQKGNLKARFPVTRMDEIGEAMLRFNKMADEIERLVERLKTIEMSRMLILQELAHDLRTPVASLQSMLETLQSKGDALKPDLRNELLLLSQKEVEYFANLVEDLLFLAQASEPRYNHTPEEVDLTEMLEAEIESSHKSNSTDGGKVVIHLTTDKSRSIKMRGDKHLLRRLLRNAIDNAVSFANANVYVSLRVSDDEKVECTFQDDGPGFNPEALKEFGRRKMSRKYTSSFQRRASIGLGSVIMNTVVTLHRGEISVCNKTDAGKPESSGKITGAEVRIILPVS